VDPVTDPESSYPARMLSGSSSRPRLLAAGEGEGETEGACWLTDRDRDSHQTTLPSSSVIICYSAEVQL